MNTQSCAVCGSTAVGDEVYDYWWWHEMGCMLCEECSSMVHLIPAPSSYGTDYDAIIQYYREVEDSGPETINYEPRMQLLR